MPRAQVQGQLLWILGLGALPSRAILCDQMGWWCCTARSAPAPFPHVHRVSRGAEPPTASLGTCVRITRTHSAEPLPAPLGCCRWCPLMASPAGLCHRPLAHQLCMDNVGLSQHVQVQGKSGARSQRTGACPLGWGAACTLKPTRREGHTHVACVLPEMWVAVRAERSSGLPGRGHKARN